MKTLTVHKQEPPGEEPQKLKALHIVAGLVVRFQSKGCGDLRQQQGYFQLGTSLVNTNQQQWVGLSLQRKIYKKDFVPLY